MASAKRHGEISKVEKIIVSPEKVVLELSVDEANYLRSVVGLDSGKVSEGIFDALFNVTRYSDDNFGSIFKRKFLGHS